MKTAPNTAVQPGRALLFTTSSGEAVRLAKPPKVIGKLKYQWRFEVDLSRHYGTLSEEVPSGSEGASFQVTLDVGWRVTDPVPIVEGRIDDGMEVVRTRLRKKIREIGREFAINQTQAFEQKLNLKLDNREATIPEGITVFQCSAQVDPDEKYSTQIGKRVEKRFDRENESLDLDHLRLNARNEDDLILLAMARDPASVPKVLDDLRRNREMTDGKRVDLFNKMVDRDLIQEADIEPYRNALMSPIAGIAGGLGAAPPPAIQAVQSPARNDEEPDIMPADIVESAPGNVTSWQPLPWETDGGAENA
ncbi:MAG: hypothetical protein ABIS86_18000 [Streptosporangiaceae bacterium]